MPANNPFLRLMHRIEATDALDAVVRRAEPMAVRLVANRTLRRFFHGDATGIPAHIVIKDVPFGAWFMAIFLDFFRDPGSDRAARRLIALGLAAAAPAGLSGWAEWVRTGKRGRRIGVVHAAANGAATLVFAASWLARRAGRQRRGAGLARLGGALLIAGGFMGGYLGSGRRAGGPAR